MPSRRQSNDDTLVELLTIIKGVDNAVMEDLRTRFEAGEMVAIEGDMSQMVDTSGEFYVFETEGLKYALQKLKELDAKSNGASKYIKSAISSYARVIANLIETPEHVITNNSDVFYNLGFLSEKCTEYCESYINMGGPNKCLDVIITSKDPVADLRGRLITEQKLIHGNVAEAMQKGLNAIESYLTMCEKCPFQANYGNRKAHTNRKPFRKIKL